jgi:hypothetical protein
MSTDNPLAGDTPIDFTQISPKQAGEALAQMTKDYHAANPDAMPETPAEATAALAAMAKTPLPPITDPIGAALAGELRNDVFTTTSPDAPMLSPYKLNETVNALREIGFPDAGVRRIIEGTPTTKEEVEWARIEKERALSDDAFVKAYLSGSRRERHWLTGLDAILAGGVAEAK